MTISHTDVAEFDKKKLHKNIMKLSMSNPGLKYHQDRLDTDSIHSNRAVS